MRFLYTTLRTLEVFLRLVFRHPFITLTIAVTAVMWLSIAQAYAFYYDNTDAVDAHATNMSGYGAGREYWLRSLVQATSTKYYIYSNWSDSSSNFWNMRRLVLTSPLASSTQVTFNYSVTRRGGSCHAGGGFVNNTGFTTASPPTAFTVFTTSSSSASYTLTTSTTTPYVWYGAISRQGQLQDCDIYFTSIVAGGAQLLTFTDASASGGDATTTVFYPLGLNAIIDDMNCLTSATGTDCTFVYSAPVQYATPSNLLIFLVVFLFAFVGAFAVVRKLSD